MGMLIDLHNHTFPKSDDSLLGVDILIDLCRQANIDAVCLTEHDTFWPSEEARRLSKRHGLLVLPGSEINTDNGHVLVFGLREYVFGMHKIDFLAQCVSKVGGAMVAAHPYRRRLLKDMDQSLIDYRLNEAKCDPLFDICDAIEGVNGRGTNEENAFSAQLAKATGLPMTGGSDAHNLNDIGKACTFFEHDVHQLEDLIQGLKGGKIAPVVL